VVLVAVKACTGPNAVRPYIRPVAATAVVVAVLLVAGCAKDQAGKSEAADHSAGTNAFTQPPADTSTVKPTAPITNPGVLEILSVLSVEEDVDLLAQHDGVVSEIARDEGSQVDKGTVLARLDDREIQAKLDHARADLLVAENNVKYNEAELKAKEAAYRRAQEMRKLGLGSQAELEEAEFKAQGAKYDLESLKAVVQRTHADIRMMELELEQTRIAAPFAGAVARRYIRAGQQLSRNDKCFRLSQLSPLRVQFLVPETAGRPAAGQSVRIRPLTDSRRTYAARVQRVSPVIDAASGSYDVTAALAGSDLGALRPGMSVRVLWAVSTSR
jgi:membrane fusion protein, multidrug efflux system